VNERKTIEQAAADAHDEVRALAASLLRERDELRRQLELALRDSQEATKDADAARDEARTLRADLAAARAALDTLTAGRDAVRRESFESREVLALVRRELGVPGGDSVIGFAHDMKRERDEARANAARWQTFASHIEAYARAHQAYIERHDHVRPRDVCEALAAAELHARCALLDAALDAAKGGEHG
jgi:chromosome segregation ATPase